MRTRNKPASTDTRFNDGEAGLVFEELEPRLLLSADLPIDLTPDFSPELTDNHLDYPLSVISEPASVAVDDPVHELVFVDTDTPDYQQLVDDILLNGNDDRSIEVVLLDNQRDGTVQISEALSERTGLDAVHLVSHGSAGSVELGNSRLDFDTLFANAEQIRGWSRAFTEQADLLIYGCELAANDAGRSLVDALGRLTGTDVAASEDITGHVSVGGDWELEYATGIVDSDVIVSAGTQQAWTASLEAVTSAADAGYARVPLAFEANVGQTGEVVDFIGRGSGYNVFLTEGDAVLQLDNGNASGVLRMHLVDSNTDAQASGLETLPGVSNYLLGNDPDDWHTNVVNYGSVAYNDVYSGIDLRYYGNQQQLEYDFVVEAGADASLIRIDMAGARTTQVAENGDLVLVLSDSGSEVRFKAPYSYQDTDSGRQTVDSRYVIHADGSLGFELGDYDASNTLVIDPVLDYGTFFGSSSGDNALGITVDAAGNAYVTGYTSGTDFPTPGTPKATTDADVFVTKLSADGTTQLYTTFLGGSGAEHGYGIAVDTGGNAYVTGSTTSADLPTANAYQNTLGGTQDAFLIKLDSAGSSVLYSSYFGGTAGTTLESAYGIDLDAAGYAYITGTTDAGDLPTKNALDNALEGTSDAYIAKFDTSLSGAGSLVYSTYIGGDGADSGQGIVVDAAGNVHITGSTGSTNLTTVNAFDASANGGNDAYVVKLNSTGSAITYSTYLGGGAADNGKGIDIDSGGTIFITGDTASVDFATTSGAYSEVYSGGASDIFVARIDPSLSGASSLLYSTYLGGSAADMGYGIAVDSAGFAIVTGDTTSSDLPVTIDALDSNLGSVYDGFVAAFNADGSGLSYLTYLGGDFLDRGNAVAVDSADSIYVAGIELGSSGFDGIGSPTYLGPGGSDDGFVVKLTSVTNIAPTATNLSAPETYVENTPLNLSDILVTDVDSTDVTATLTLSDPAVGALSTATSGAVVSSYDAGTGVWSASGAIADVNALLDGVVFTPGAGSYSDFTIATRVDDGVAPAITGSKAVTGVAQADLVSGLWLTTETANPAPSGANGLATEGWADGEMLVFSDPNLSLGSGTTDGTFARAFNLSDFTQDGSSSITGFHVVGRPITVGSNAMQLLPGDLIISPQTNETFVSSDASTLAVGLSDVVLFRPDTPGDYSAGAFSMLIDGSDIGWGSTVTAITLVEQDTVVGSGGGAATLNAGDFLMVQWGGTYEQVYRFQPGTLGDVSSGSFSLLIDGNDLGIDNGATPSIAGLDLVERNTVIGGTTLNSGEILMTLKGNDASVGGISTDHHDIFLVDLSSTGATTIGTASPFFTGADVGLDSWQENVYGLSLVPDNYPPIAANDGFSVNEGSTTNLDLALNDTDFDGTLDPGSISIVSGPANGAVVVNGDGTVDYTHDGSETTSDSFSYTIRDSNGATSNAATVSISVTPVNDAPTTSGITDITVNEDTLVTGFDLAPSFADSEDPDTSLVYTITANSNPGLFLSTTIGGSFINLNYAPDQYGAADITIRATDSGGLFVESTFTVTVNPVNDAPVAVDDNYTINEDAGGFLPIPGVMLNDSDPESDPLTAVLVSGPSHGTLTLNGNGSYWYWPDANYNGSDSFTYKVNDGSLDSGIATVGITLTPVNDAPVANADNVVTDEDLALSNIDVLGNDTDVDGDSLSVTGATALNGSVTINGDGSLNYAPNGNFNGTDVVNYTISDANGGLSGGVLNVTVNPVNDSPVAVDDFIIASEDSGQTAGAPGVMSNDSDVEDPAGLYVSAVNGNPAAVGNPVSLASGAIVTVNADGSSAYNSNGAFEFLGTGDTAADSFSYTLSDANGAVSVANVNVLVFGVNDDPLAANDAYTMNEDATFTGTPGVNDLLLNDADTDGDVLTVDTTPVSDVSNGVLVLNADGSFVYTPDVDFNGVDSFSYKVNDGAADSNIATVTFNVNPVNDAPSGIVPGAQTTVEDAPLLFSSVAGNGISVADPDAVGSTLEMTLTASKGTLTLGGISGLGFVSGDGDADQTMTFTGTATDINAALEGMRFAPDFGYQGPAGVQLIVDDLGNGGGGALNSIENVSIAVVAASASPGLYPIDDLYTDPPAPDANPVDSLFPAPSEVGAETDGESAESESEASGPAHSPAPGADAGIPSDSQSLTATLEVTAFETRAAVFAQQAHDDSSNRPGDRQDNGVRPVADGSTADLPATAAFQPAPPFWGALDQMLGDMDGDKGAQTTQEQLIATTGMGLSFTLTAGYVSWLLRMGYLSASVLSMAPLWREFDPLPILSGAGADDTEGCTDKDERKEQQEASEAMFGREPVAGSTGTTL